MKLCATCLRKLAPPVTESAADWNSFLHQTGNGVSRGVMIGPDRLAYEHEVLPDGPLSGHESPLERIPDGGDIEAALDNEKLLAWFLSAPAREVALKLGIGHEAVQRLRASYLDCDRAEVETARKVLGYSEAEWQRRKLGIGLIESRAAIERQKFAA